MMAPTIVEILSILPAPMIAAWLLSMASEEILIRYSCRISFVAAIGTLFAVYGDLFSQKPFDLMILASINNLIALDTSGIGPRLEDNAEESQGSIQGLLGLHSLH
jgi:hypothetical protein